MKLSSLSLLKGGPVEHLRGFPQRWWRRPHSRYNGSRHCWLISCDEWHKSSLHSQSRWRRRLWRCLWQAKAVLWQWQRKIRGRWERWAKHCHGQNIAGHHSFLLLNNFKFYLRYFTTSSLFSHLFIRNQKEDDHATSANSIAFFLFVRSSF